MIQECEKDKELVGSDGRVHHYAPATIEKWYLGYQNHGFDALVPKSRADLNIITADAVMRAINDCELG